MAQMTVLWGLLIPFLGEPQSDPPLLSFSAGRFFDVHHSDKLRQRPFQKDKNVLHFMVREN